MKNKVLYLIIASQVVLNAFTIIYSAKAIDPCATAIPAKTVTKTATPNAPTFAFSGSLSKYPEKNNLVVYASISSKSGEWLNNYRIKFFKNGNVVENWVSSTAYKIGETHPPKVIGGNVIESGIPSHDYNFKIDFNPLVVGSWFDPEGDWTATLTDGDGKALSNELTFSISKNDENKEIYLEFQRN